MKGQSDSSSKANDSLARERVFKKRTYSAARRASIMSAIMPGLGQLANRKYWKVPLIYGTLGGFGYMFYHNNDQYRFYRKNLIAYYDTDSATINTTKFSGQDLKDQRDYYLKNRNFGAIGFCLIYLLNIVDANVDAHLKTFDVSDDLSLQIKPWQNINVTSLGYNASTGISIRLTFK